MVPVAGVEQLGPPVGFETIVSRTLVVLGGGVAEAKFAGDRARVERDRVAGEESPHVSFT